MNSFWPSLPSGTMGSVEFLYIVTKVVCVEGFVPLWISWEFERQSFFHFSLLWFRVLKGFMVV